MTEAEYEFKLKCFDRFLELGPTVWNNWSTVVSTVTLGFDSPRAMRAESHGVLAAIQYRSGDSRLRNPSAIGRILYRRMPGYTLLITPQLFQRKMAQADLDKILLHELVHLGYGGHGADFRKVCKEVGGVISGEGVTDPGTHLEARQPNGRYARVKTFATEAEARAWFGSMEQRLARGEKREAWLAENPGKTLRQAEAALRWRIVYG